MTGWGGGGAIRAVQLDPTRSPAVQGPRGRDARSATPPMTGTSAAAPNRRPRRSREPLPTLPELALKAPLARHQAQPGPHSHPELKARAPLGARGDSVRGIGVGLSPEDHQVTQTCRDTPCRGSRVLGDTREGGSVSGASPCICVRPLSPPRSPLRP